MSETIRLCETYEAALRRVKRIRQDQRIYGHSVASNDRLRVALLRVRALAIQLGATP